MSSLDPGRLLAAIAASSNDAIVGKDLNGIVMSWNVAAERLFGFTAAEMIGASITRIIPPDRLHEEVDILERVARGEVLAHFETERRAKDGRIIPISVTISPIRGAAGEVIGVSKIARDLTQTQAMTAELRRREALLQSILDTVPDGLIVIDGDGIIRSFNTAAERMFGFAAAEVAGCNVSVLMPDSHAAAHDGYLNRYAATREAHIIGMGRVTTGRRRSGATFPIELQIGEVDVAGSHLFTGFVRDLTERHDRERRLAELQAELIHVSRLSELGQMVSGLAHEVNQPLTAIAMYVQGIRRLLAPNDKPWADETPAIRQAIERIGEQADRAHRIVQGLRGMVRKEERPSQVADLETMVRETVDLALSGAGRSVSAALRIAADGRLAWVNKVQIQQVLLNLIRNAVEAMAGAAVSRLTVSTARRGDRIEITVADNGPGLADAVRDRLFQPFVTTKEDGLGMGLSICRAIVEGHGGDITVRSEPGHGTEFAFTVATPPDDAALTDLDQ